RPARLMLRDRQFFVFYSSADHPVLHSFPTRRSSDLPAYRNVVLERPPAHAQPVTRLHRFRPLGAGAVELDLAAVDGLRRQGPRLDRKSTRLNSSHEWISYAVFCLKKKRNRRSTTRLN